jgi:hypothetical protein
MNIVPNDILNAARVFCESPHSFAYDPCTLAFQFDWNIWNIQLKQAKQSIETLK